MIYVVNPLLCHLLPPKKKKKNGTGFTEYAKGSLLNIYNTVLQEAGSKKHQPDRSKNSSKQVLTSGSLLLPITTISTCHGYRWALVISTISNPRHFSGNFLLWLSIIRSCHVLQEIFHSWEKQGLDEDFPRSPCSQDTNMWPGLVGHSSDLDRNWKLKKGQGRSCSNRFPEAPVAKFPLSLLCGCNARRDTVRSLPTPPPGSVAWLCLSCWLPRFQLFLPVFRTWFSSPSPCAFVTYHYCFNKFLFS